MVEEQVRFELTQLATRWTVRNSESKEIWPIITKTEFLAALQEVLKVTFEIDSTFLPIITPQNSTMCLDPQKLAQIVDCNDNIPDSYTSLETLPMDIPISPCEYACEEVCRSEEKTNTTINFSDPPRQIKIEKELDTTTTVTKVVSNPIVYINEVGRSDTFEIENKNTTMDLVDSKSNVTDLLDDVSSEGKELEDLTKKLKMARNEISGIANAAINIASEIHKINKQLQKKVNRFGVPRRRSSLSPMAAATPIVSRSNTPKSNSLRRKSSSFSAIAHEDKNKLNTSSPSRAKSTNSLSTRNRSPISRGVLYDPGELRCGTKNPKFAHIRSTIPKASPTRKKI